jgi:hypothetical protein
MTYAVAGGLGLAWLTLGPESPWLLLDSLIADLLATSVIFAASRAAHNSSFYDAWWSVAPPGDAALPQHHRRVWPAVRRRIEALGARVHPGRRAEVPPGLTGERITTEPPHGTGGIGRWAAR